MTNIQPKWVVLVTYRMGKAIKKIRFNIDTLDDIKAKLPSNAKLISFIFD